MWVRLGCRTTLKVWHPRRTIQLKVVELGERGEGIARLKPNNPLSVPKVVLLPGTIPGEVVTIVDSEERKDGCLVGEVGTIEVTSPHRNPKVRCLHYSDCGACSLMHIKYNHQLTVKEEEVRKAFAMAGVEIEVPRCIPSPTRYFRSTVNLVVQESAQEDRREPSEDQEERPKRSRSLKVGYYHKLSSLLVTSISSCLVAVPQISNLIPKIGRVLEEFRELRRLRHISIKATSQDGLLLLLAMEGKKKSKKLDRYLIKKKKQRARLMAKLEGEEPRERFADQEEKEDSESVPLDRNLSEILRSFANRLKEEENSITAVLLKTESGWDNLSNPTPPTTPTTLAPTPSAPSDGNDQLTHLLRESILGSEFVVSPGSFVQTNFVQAEKIYSRVIDSVAADDKVIDAYSGVGILSSLLAKKARKVIGIEHSEEAVKDARENARRNAVQDRCEFIQGPVEQILGTLLSRKGKKNEEKPSVVILNPPRNGVKEAVIESLSEGLPPKIIYVSCNPYSLARDLSFLMSRANYSLQLSLFDMFPHTMHVELVATLTLKHQ